MNKLPVPFNLRSEYLNSPVGIDIIPRFSWSLKCRDRGIKQSAYQIICSDKLSEIEREIGSLWNTGKVKSSESTNILYQGKNLESCRRYYWCIRWWDNSGNFSDYSQLAIFETGILKEREWIAKWIGREEYKKSILQQSDVFPHTTKPIAVGFGISTPEQAREIINAGAQGIIVGSAIVKIIEENREGSLCLKRVGEFAKKMKMAIKP